MTNEQRDTMATIVQQVVRAREAVGKPVTSRFEAAKIARQLLNEPLTDADLTEIAERSVTVTEEDIQQLMAKLQKESE